MILCVSCRPPPLRGKCGLRGIGGPFTSSTDRVGSRLYHGNCDRKNYKENSISLRHRPAGFWLAERLIHLTNTAASRPLYNTNCV